MCTNIDGLFLTSLKVIKVPGGDVLQGIKFSDCGYEGFGEAYFSMIEQGVVKAWKRHSKMTMNLVVPMGKVKFVIYDDRQNSSSNGKFQEVILSKNNYCRLTVPPMVWLGFKGLDKNTSILLNVANIEHVFEEAERKEINEIRFDWELIK
jgi:dTDP-4-dehydrorhamnose 3,5-epimerase